MKILLAFAIGLLTFSMMGMFVEFSSPWLSDAQTTFLAALTGILGFLISIMMPAFLAPSTPSTSLVLHKRRTTRKIRPVTAMVSVLWGAFRIEMTLVTA